MVLLQAKDKKIQAKMIQSMTGFGKADVVFNGKKIHVEVRSLNSKSLDLNTRVAPLYREKEMEVRRIIATAIERGKVDFTIWIEKDETSAAGCISSAVVASYVAQIKNICEEQHMELPQNLWEIVPNLAIAHAIAELLRKFKPKFCIFDPVLISSSGLSFVDNETYEFMLEELMPLCQLITPNLPEARHLAQLGDATADELAQYLYNKLKGTPVMVKGGHLPGSPTDYFFDGALHKFQSERLNSHNTHGTGCVLSSAIASYKAQGLELKDAIAQAKQFLFNAIKQGANYKHGNGCGPLYLVP
jgi:hydroxymethylpyrimidine kinase/phosphomethylpyrimidine kinase